MQKPFIITVTLASACVMFQGCAGMRDTQQAELDTTPTRRIVYSGFEPRPVQTNDLSETFRVYPYHNIEQKDGRPLEVFFKIANKEYDLSLEDAIKFALEYNHEVKSAKYARQAADGYIDQAFAEAMPNLALSANAQNNFSLDENNDSYGVNARLTQPIWRGGAVSAGLEYAKYYAVNADSAIKVISSEVIRSVSEKYYTALLCKRLVEVGEESVAVQERLLQTTSNRRAQGIALEYEVLRAEVGLASAKADLISAQNDLQRAEVALFEAMGIAQSNAVKFTDQLVYENETFGRLDMFRSANTSRPELSRAMAAVRMAEQNLAVVKSAYRPKFDAFGSVGYNNNRAGEWNDEIIVGATATMQLYDGMKKRGRIAVAESEINQANEALSKTRDDIWVQVVNALNQLDYAEKLYASQSRNIDAAKIALRMIEDGFANGRNRQYEVNDAHAAFTDAMGAYHRAVHAHIIAKLNVRAAAGQLNPQTK